MQKAEPASCNIRTPEQVHSRFVAQPYALIPPSTGPAPPLAAHATPQEPQPFDATAPDAPVDVAAAAAAAAAAASAPGAPGGAAWRVAPEAERAVLAAVLAAGVTTGAPAVANSLPKPSLFKLWQIFSELWNDACQRHGLRRLVPLDPLGLFVAIRRHRDLLQRQVRSQLGLSGRVVAAAPLGTEVEPDVLDGAAGQGAAGERGGGQGGDGSSAVAEEVEAAARAASALGELGASPQEMVEAGVAAAAAAAAANAARHHSPVVGETPTGATIHAPATALGPGGAAQAAGWGPGAATGTGTGTQRPGQGVMPNLKDPDVLLEVRPGPGNLDWPCGCGICAQGGHDEGRHGRLARTILEN